ncbi:hypothetical protein Q667_17615 [Marinobacter sp. C1S70]|uniref:hypothetical protein n=1 Tax=Marinobacter sp. C1S70 TaxID=1396859 RepID=UPI0003B8C377|nr:hypothetical protein [Marinobacter sp. C1S70]ERS85202.1 hypothetical protein Q667_17615 [Marinobacter sp. C1S70]
MKVFKKSALVLAMTASAGMAHAAGVIDVAANPAIDVGPAPGNAVGVDQSFQDAVSNGVDGSGPVFLDKLLTANKVAIDLADSTAGAGNVDVVREIVYSPNTTISEGSTVTFEVSNAVIDSSTNLQLNDASGAKVATLTDFTLANELDTASGYKVMRFVVDPAAELAAGSPYVMSNGTSQVTVITNPGLSVGDTVTLAATSAQDSSGIPIAQGTAPAEAIVEVVNGTVVDLDAVTSTINVESDPSRTEFVARGTSSVAPYTDVKKSVAEVDISIGAEVTLDLTGRTFTLDLTRDTGFDGVDAITLDVGDDGVTTANVPFALNTAKTAWVATGPATALTNDHSIAIDVNGTAPFDVLQTGNWVANLKVDADTANNLPAIDVISDAETHLWDINGAQFKIPYHAQNASGFVFFFKAVNETTNDAAIAADVIVENTTQGTRETVSGVDLGIAKAQGNITVGQDAIKTAIKAAGGDMNDEDIYHVHMQLTVNAPQNEIQVAAFQKDAAGRTVVPVYINSNNVNDGRKWQQ